MSRKRRDRRDAEAKARRDAEPRKLSPAYCCGKCGEPLDKKMGDDIIAAQESRGYTCERVEICHKCQSWNTPNGIGGLRLMTPAECFDVRMRAPHGAEMSDKVYTDNLPISAVIQDCEPPCIR